MGKIYPITRRLAMLAACYMSSFMPVYGLVVWDGSAPITASVTDDDIAISNNNLIADRVYVNAVAQDILVSVSQTDAIVSSSAQLHFYAEAGRTITIDLQGYSLGFTGTQANQFLVTFSGEGALDIICDGDASLILDGAPTYTLINGLLPSAGPGVVFAIIGDSIGGQEVAILRADNIPQTTLHGLIVGQNSTFCFTSPTLQRTSSVLKLNASTNMTVPGRMGMFLDDNAGFLVTPISIGNAANPIIADINFNDVVSGSSVRVECSNDFPGSYFSGFLIVNSNLTWNQLQSNPFCQDAITSPTAAGPRGFVLGSNSLLNFLDDSYLDYVVTRTNVTLNPTIPDAILNDPCERFLTTVIKDRNPAAFIIDGVPNDVFFPAQIRFAGNSAIYFRSIVNCNGEFNILDTGSEDFSYLYGLVDPATNFTNEGTIVFDVEGTLLVTGDGNSGSGNALQILSLQVTPTGGSVLINQPETNFPLRTFAKNSDGTYAQYGSACAMINNRIYLRNGVHWQHTDMLHPIYYNNELVGPSALFTAPDIVPAPAVQTQSAASYIGGDRINFNCPDNYPKDNRIELFNSFFDFHTSAAFTGVDITVSQDVQSPESTNASELVFYSNGRCIDQGTGRVVVMGTEVGCQASDFKTIVNRNAHIDVLNTDTVLAGVFDLNLTTSINNTKITEGITGDISNQPPVHTIYLGWGSNISIGNQTDGNAGQFNFGINGSFFSLMTQGGDTNEPSNAATSGQGGIFVDQGGYIGNNGLRCNIGTMVVTSGNGLVGLNPTSAFFSPRVGLAHWRLDLGNATEQTIVAPGDYFSDYTIDWQNIRKDFCTSPVFVPYEPADTPAPGTAPAVTDANLTGLPLIQGTVDQLQVKNSRLGDQATLMVDGGFVREFVFLTGDPSTSLPIGILGVQNNGIIGLGSASRNIDSSDAQVVLGINGIMLLANGDGTIRLNTNTIINNLCHILTGTLFGLTSENSLTIESVVPTELRVKAGGVLDLTQFTNSNQTLVIGGKVNMVLEPGAQVLMGGGNLVFVGDSQLYLEPNTNTSQFIGSQVSATDEWRARWSGNGRVTIKENAQVTIPRGSILGIESFEGGQTAQSWLLSDDARLLIGADDFYGGVLQIGNTTTPVSPLITFSLFIDGKNSLVDINSQGMLGLGVGVASKPEGAPNTWYVGALSDVASISIINREGVLKHQQIYSGDNKLAGLFALQNNGSYTFQFDQTNGSILGGGNMVLLSSISTTTSYHPTVLQTTVSQVGNDIVTPGIMSSAPTLLNRSKAVLAVLSGNSYQVNSASGATLFTYLAMNPFQDQFGKTAAIFRSSLGQVTLGFVFTQANVSLIERISGVGIKNTGGQYVNPDSALAIGCVGITANANFFGNISVEAFQLNPQNP